MPEPQLYWVSGSPYSWRVLLALAFKGLGFRSHLLKPDEGDFDDPDFRRISPRGQVPAFVDGDVMLSESLAIMAYLDRRQPKPPLFGTSAAETGTVWARILDFVGNLEPYSKRIVKSLYAGNEVERREELMDCADKVRAELDRIEAGFDASGWVVGESVSAADFAIYPFLKSLFRTAANPRAAILDLRILPIERRYPNIDRWMGGIEAFPFYDDTYPPGWRQEEID